MNISLKILFVCVILLFSTSVSGSMIKLEDNTDRPGAVHLGRVDNVGSAQECLELCKKNPRCVAFTWVRPGYQGNTGVCWLKGSVTKKVSNKCCVSGIVSIKPWGGGGGGDDDCYCVDSQGRRGHLVLGNQCFLDGPPYGAVQDFQVICP